MAITLSDYPAVESPAACPKCGSMDISTPWNGRRTNLWLAGCRDCGTKLRSGEQFTVIARKQNAVLLTPREDLRPHRIETEGFQKLSRAALQRLNASDPKLRQTREPGEEG